MKFSVTIPGLTLYPNGRGHWSESVTAADIRRIARRCDELGFDYLHVSEHMAMHRSLVPTMGTRWSHALTAMAMLAGATERIGITGLIVVPYHHPVTLAKALATIDVLSGGRLAFLAAVGYMEWEFDLLGVPFAERGPRMDEYMEAIFELWESDEPEYEGQFVSFRDIVFEPKPQQKPRPPVWFAGHAKPAVRRLARLGDGWITYDTTRAELPGMLDYIREQPDFQARPRLLEIGMPLFEGKLDPATHEVLEPPRIVLEKDAIFEQVQILADLGTTMVRSDMALGSGGFRQKGGADSLEEYLERLEWLGSEILPVAQRP